MSPRRVPRRVRVVSGLRRVPLHHPAITAAIVDGRNAKQVEGVIAAASFRLSEEEFAEIQGYLAQHVS